MSETFSAALRAELDAVVGRYEALVRALAAVSERDAEDKRAEIARLASEVERLRADSGAQSVEIARLTSLAEDRARRIDELERDIANERRKAGALARTAQEAQAVSLAYEEQFSAERRFVDACGEIAGSLLIETIVAILGRPLDGTSATFAALKGRGLEPTLAAVFKERGRSTGHAPLLERERAALPALAAAAGCELIVPADGTRFSAGSMEKGGTLSDPAEEGNVVSCAMPGLRRTGTDGALVFPRVVVATG